MYQHMPSACYVCCGECRICLNAKGVLFLFAVFCLHADTTCRHNVSTNAKSEIVEIFRRQTFLTHQLYIVRDIYMYYMLHMKRTYFLWNELSCFPICRTATRPINDARAPCIGISLRAYIPNARYNINVSSYTSMCVKHVFCFCATENRPINHFSVSHRNLESINYSIVEGIIVQKKFAYDIYLQGGLLVCIDRVLIASSFFFRVFFVCIWVTLNSAVCHPHCARWIGFILYIQTVE